VRDAALPPETSRVTSLELFFDLVFVFTITELTNVLNAESSARGLLQVVLMLAVIWWMYGGYAWMTNAVAADTVNRRLLLLGGMGGYLLLALAIPHAFSGSGLAFGLAYLAIVAVHTGLFTRATSQSVVRAILRLFPLNVLSALVIVAGGALGGTAQYVLWAVAIGLQWLTPVISGLEGFDIDPAHFVERHGLVLLIAIGESVVATGIGASGVPVDGRLAAVALLGLAVSACLWWLSFGRDEDERAERSMALMAPIDRARRALAGFFYCYLAMLLGIVAIAAAERSALAHPASTLTTARAVFLGGGAALFLGGNALFRRSVEIGPGGLRAAAAVIALATIPLGVGVSAAAQIAALVALLGGAIAVEQRAPVTSP
jgi:low temperature requirement protein LtrA